MAEEQTFFKHSGVRQHDEGAIAQAAKDAGKADHHDKYGEAGTYEFLRLENFQQRNWREGLGGGERHHECSVTVVWQHKP